jgi:hypothetical protein
LCENKKPYPPGEEFVRIEYEEPPSNFIGNFFAWDSKEPNRKS